MRRVAPVLLVLGLACCKSASPATGAAAGPVPSYSDVLIEDVPHVRQKPDFCGEACAEMFLRKLGHEIDQDQVFVRTGLDPLLARGAFAADLKKALGHIGFDVGPVWTRIEAAKADKGLERQFELLHDDLKDGIPSIVCTHYDEGENATEHFRLVLGYDAESDEVIYHEPAVDAGAYQRMKRTDFLDLWPLKYAEDEWTIIRFRLDPGEITGQEAIPGFTAADYAQHMIVLRPMIPSEGFTVVIEPPFVVIGDESPDIVAFRAEKTVRWATQRLEQDFFEKDPGSIIDIWLFGSEESYYGHARSIFGHEPDTPYGYYSPDYEALIMNIATGGGTLVHEIVHPFVAANVPNCPAWINEGLGSLYEACSDKDGQIRGLTNWRLPGLQRAITDDMVPTFENLSGVSDARFYGDSGGIYYAQSRYICYYLEQRGLLRRFYHQYLANQASDPTGYQTLQDVLGNPDMEQFQQDWEDYVMGLSYPPAE